MSFCNMVSLTFAVKAVSEELISAVAFVRAWNVGACSVGVTFVQMRDGTLVKVFRTVVSCVAFCALSVRAKAIPTFLVHNLNSCE
jgi:hypothetical protein